MKVFVSYSSSDREFAQRVANALRAHGLSVWYDQWEIRVGDSIVAKIAEGIGASDALVILLSTASVASPWVAEELNAATMRSIESRKLLLLPARREPCAIPVLLKHRRYADFAQSFESGMFDLLEALVPLERLWTNLRDLQRRHDATLQSIAEAAITDDVSHLVKYVYDLMIMAMDVRIEIEARADLAASPASARDLPDKIAILAERGIDLRSETFYKLANLRLNIAHRLGGDYGHMRLLVQYFASEEDVPNARERLNSALDRLRELMNIVASPESMVADGGTHVSPEEAG